MMKEGYINTVYRFLFTVLVSRYEGFASFHVEILQQSGLYGF